MATVEGAGVELAYDERGAGPAVVLVHGAAADRAVWRSEVDALADAARVLAYDRRGYGGSGAPQPYERTTVQEQAEDLAALLRTVGAAPAVAVGADVGALAVLDVVRRHPGLVRAAVLVDPPVLQLVPEALEALSAERAALEAALRTGGREHAVAAWLGARGVDRGERLERARRDAAAFFADYGGQATLPLARRDLRGLDLPVAVLDGRGTPPHARAASDAVSALVPGARRGAEGGVPGAVRELLAS